MKYGCSDSTVLTDTTLQLFRLYSVAVKTGAGGKLARLFDGLKKVFNTKTIQLRRILKKLKVEQQFQF
jgi:hypothetical protein